MIRANYCVYLLKSTVSNKVYLGYTVNNPCKRLRQHNGELSGGANFTKRFRPWKVIMFVTFQFEKTAMQYEFLIHKAKKRGVLGHIRIMKQLLRKERICSTAPLNSEFKKMICFSDEATRQIWINA